MDQSQINALSLFQEGEYEKAIESMAQSTTVSSEEFKKFVQQCNSMLSEQYKYIINEALSSRDYHKANSLREEFRQKHGNNPVIEALPIPSTTPINSSIAQSVSPVEGKVTKTNSKKRYYIIGGIVALIIIVAIILIASSSDESSSGGNYNDITPVEEVVVEEMPVEEEYEYDAPTYEQSHSSYDYRNPSSSNQDDYSDFE